MSLETPMTLSPMNTKELLSKYHAFHATKMQYDHRLARSDTVLTLLQEIKRTTKMFAVYFALFFGRVLSRL